MKRQQIIEFMDEHGINYRLVEHEAVFTVADLDNALSENVPTKCLLLEEQKGSSKYMVVMRGMLRLDTKKLANNLGSSKLQFVRPEFVEGIVGVKPGSVSIFGLLHPGSKSLTVAIDKALLDEEVIGFHPNDNTATVFVSPDDMLKVIKNTSVKYKIVDL
jgi:Ala-tRNA(Pro) deacylase